MGLDFSHCDAHWAYSSFNQFRRRLFSAMLDNLNMPHPRPLLDEMAGYGGELQIPWSDIPQDPLIALLNHSDDDGHLSAEECAKIAPRLRELIELMPRDTVMEYRDYEQCLMLADGMEKAAAAGEQLEFI